MPELIEGTMKAGSKLAILIEVDGQEIWIPKSQIDCMKGFKAIIPISDYIAHEKGLITDDEYDKRRAQYKGNQPKQENLPF